MLHRPIASTGLIRTWRKFHLLMVSRLEICASSKSPSMHSANRLIGNQASLPPLAILDPLFEFTHLLS